MRFDVRLEREGLTVNDSPCVDNFLPDSVDKSSGTVAVSPDGEVNVHFLSGRTGEVEIVPFIIHATGKAHVSGHVVLLGAMASGRTRGPKATKCGLFQDIRTRVYGPVDVVALMAIRHVKMRQS